MEAIRGEEEGTRAADASTTILLVTNCAGGNVRCVIKSNSLYVRVYIHYARVQREHPIRSRVLPIVRRKSRNEYPVAYL